MIGGPRYDCERLDDHHQRASFSCSREPALQAYFTDDSRAIRENKRSISAVHVIVDNENSNRIAAYFSLSKTSSIPTSLPNAIARKLPRYDHWPATLLGRMARDDRYAGGDIGTILLANALEKTMHIISLSASMSLIVEAKNEKLAAWYTGRGFRLFPETPHRLFMVNATIVDLIARICVGSP